MIVGLIKADSASIGINDIDITSIPIHKRFEHDQHRPNMSWWCLVLGGISPNTKDGNFSAEGVPADTFADG